eukprot:1332736-Prymnesium_polylepis.1
MAKTAIGLHGAGRPAARWVFAKSRVSRCPQRASLFTPRTDARFGRTSASCTSQATLTIKKRGALWKNGCGASWRPKRDTIREE